MEWTHRTGDRYIATGVDLRGRRFRISSESMRYIEGINVYRGSKWAERDGKRTLLDRIFN